jgi:hypothetical protein
VSRIGTAASRRWRQPKGGALLSGLTAAVIARLSPTAIDAILTSSVSPADRQTAQWALVAHRGGRDELSHLDGAPAAVIAQLAGDAPELVASQLDRAIDELLGQAGRDVEEARAGARGFGGPDTFTLLAVAAISNGSASLRKATAALIEASLSENLPADVRFQALRGLTVIAHHREIDVEALESLARAPLAGSDALLVPTPSALMEVARLTLLAAAGRQLAMEGLVLIRDEDAQVRDLAVEACSLMVRNQDSEILETALASALFDPDSSIVARALRHFTAVPPRSRIVRPAVARRVLLLFERGGRDIRAAAVTAIAAGILGEDHRRQAKDVLAKARDDRSFVVRDAAEPVSS